MKIINLPKQELARGFAALALALGLARLLGGRLALSTYLERDFSTDLKRLSASGLRDFSTFKQRRRKGRPFGLVRNRTCF
jgi:hypothetical protein